MLTINPENVIKSAESSLKKKTFGGVSLESAKEAIQKTADGVKQLADNAIGSVQQELQNFKGKSAQEMAEMTSKKDAIILSKDNQIKELSEMTSEKDAIILSKDNEIKELSEIFDTASKLLRRGKGVFVWGKPKETKRGTLEINRSNRNGARMTIEITQPTPDGEASLLKAKLTNNDGDVRTTYYLLNYTGNKKHIRTKSPINEGNINLSIGVRKFTYTDVNNDMKIHYDRNGDFKSKELVNQKKVTKKLYSEDFISSNSDTGIDRFKKLNIDGSYQIEDYDNNRQMLIKTSQYNSKGQRYKESYIQFDDDGKIESRVTTKFNPENGVEIEELTQYADGSWGKVFYNEEGSAIKLEGRTAHGLKRIMTATKDKYGELQRCNADLKYIYPESSPIKEANIDSQGKFFPQKETLLMKDGSIVSIDLKFLRPQKVTIIKPDEPPKILEKEEGIDFLNKIGKISSSDDSDYYVTII